MPIIDHDVSHGDAIAVDPNPRHMEIYQIRYFLTVAETLNFTRAAERCFVSQPALTKSIQRLEEIVGGRLLDRSKKSVSLTAFGQSLLPSFKKIYDTTLEVRENARQLLRHPLEKVRVGVMCTLDFREIVQGLQACNQQHPGIVLSFHPGSLELISNAVDIGDVDLGIVCSPYEIPNRFAEIALYEERFVLAVGPDHRFSKRTSISLSELDQERYCDRTACEYSDHIDQKLNEQGITLNVVQESDREDWIAAMVRANFGVSFMPASIATIAGLPSVDILDNPFVRTVKLLVQTGRPLTVAQQTVMDSLRAYGQTRIQAMRNMPQT